MIFAAISDVHGNYAALEAVLADIKRLGIEDIVNLGDCFSGPLDAARTAQLLIDAGMPGIRGNHDRALVEQSFDEMGPWEKIVYPQFSPSDLEWLRALPFDMVFKDVAYCCHGSPAGDLDYWLERMLPEGVLHLRARGEIEALASEIKQPLMLCGHTHIARTVQLPDGRLIVNPGSVGCPGWKDEEPFYHQVDVGHSLASYAVLEETAHGWQVTHRQIPYDAAPMAELARLNGMARVANAIASGWLD
ncbi:metallophosphoesterase family protein [Agrobacterium larrymoorei]|uniref:Metallophosphoesterase family protein n=1 Tax=Agrobacterium larrymoorei TaxID=160699 RepID=A0AAF0HC69_9HYPH|nr:metallophosphoesterase family protein [Agrobacterium larrymoorei]WHA41795.1 metallophosphoesterase family protein [Agrobacterium larrymoorei]